MARQGRRRLRRSRVRLGTVVGFPHGGQILAVKAFEASKALEQGAAQIDFVVNGGALLSGDEETVLNDMLAVIDMVHSALGVAGVIVESDPMPVDQLRRACRIAERAGADYVVTGTGASTARTTVERSALLRDSVGPRVQVKAAGRLRRIDDLRAAADAGAATVATRFSAELARTAGASLKRVGDGRRAGIGGGAQVVDAPQPAGGHLDARAHAVAEEGGALDGGARGAGAGAHDVVRAGPLGDARPGAAGRPASDSTMTPAPPSAEWTMSMTASMSLSTVSSSPDSSAPPLTTESICAAPARAPCWPRRPSRPGYRPPCGKPTTVPRRTRERPE